MASFLSRVSSVIIWQVSKHFLIAPALILTACFFVLTFRNFYRTEYLSFSDGAKFADIAKNITLGKGYNSYFSNFASKDLGFDDLVSVSRWTPPAMPFAIAGSFRLFGISDSSVIVTSSLFYILLVLTTYLLGKKIWGEFVGVLSGLALTANINFLEYATNGASETLFALEIVLTAYLLVFRKKWANIAALIVCILMYFTRAQAVIYIFGYLFLFSLFNLPVKKAIGFFVGLLICGLIAYLFVSKQGLFAVTQHLPGVASSDALRGGIQTISVSELFKKVFYNLYNFYRLLPQIASPFMWTFFTIGLFKRGNDTIENFLKFSSLFMVTTTFLVSALTIPLFRYIHPVVPLVYLLAVATLVWIVEKMVKNLRFKINDLRINISNKLFVNLTAIFLIMFFVVGQTLGIIFLDSRYEAKTVNKGKPPVYVTLSKILKENSNPDDVIITNLDTWGSWYGERRTIWYPLKPEQLVGLEDTADVIYLTSYLIDDENYYMGEEWRQIFENPKSYKNDFIAKNYKFAGEFTIPPDENYEKQESRAILLVRK